MSGYTTFHKIDVSFEEVLACLYSKWSPKFSLNSAKSRVIRPLPKQFLQYLASDSIKLSTNTDTVVGNSDNEYSDWEEDEGEAEEGSDKAPSIDDFLLLHQEIGGEIAALGGQVTPKLNWLAPKDARWIMPGNTMKCVSADDVYLLLNASDHIVDDLDYPFSSVDNVEEDKTKAPQVEFELVLRQWVDINPALEFRVFVYQGRILGVSQRDLNHYVFLETLKDELKQVIEEFVMEEAVKKLEDLGLQKYVLDVYVPRPFKKVFLVDVNPFTRKSDSLLFTWHELLEETLGSGGESYEFRIITHTNVGRFARKEYSESQVPLDIVDASLNAGSMVELAREWEKIQLEH